GVLAVQGEVAGRPLDRVEHQPAREADAPVRPVDGADAGQRLDAARYRICEADRLQRGEHRLVDAFEIVLLQWPIAAALEPGAHRPYILRKRRRTHRTPRLASARAPAARCSRRFLLVERRRHVQLRFPGRPRLCRAVLAATASLATMQARAGQPVEPGKAGRMSHAASAGAWPR